MSNIENARKNARKMFEEDREALPERPQGQSTPKESSQETMLNENTGNNKFTKLQALLQPFDTSIPVEKTEFIGGLYPRGYVSVIVAPSGTGKSLFIQQNFTELSKGGKFLDGHDDIGAKCFKDNEPERKCVILCGELGAQGLRERAQEFALHPKPENVIVLDQTACEANGYSFILNTPEGIANLEYVIQQTKPDILFIDSLTAFFTGKESDNSETNLVFGKLRSIASNYKIALVIAHHSRKRLSSEQGKPLTLDDVVGAGAITRHVYLVLALEYNANTKINKVVCLKSWSRKIKPFGFSVKYSLYNQPYIDIDFAVDVIDDDKLNSGTNRTGQNPEWQSVVRGFLLGRGKEGASVQEILQAIGKDDIERETFIKRLNRMADSGEITRTKRGYYAIPDDKLIHTEKDNEKDNRKDNEKT